MNPFTLAALIFSIIAIALWIVTFTQGRTRRSVETATAESPPTTDNHPAVVDDRQEEPAVPTGATQNDQEDFMKDLTKFSQMVRKNLEIINTRIGIKFDIKPLSQKSRDTGHEKYVASMDVSGDTKNADNHKPPDH
ncbi:MAG: hypothetical protein QXN26_03860 [Thermoplasmataceae archaeon]